MKKGERIVLLLRGAGTETASIQTIESVKKGVITLDNEMGTFHLDGLRATENVIFGFSKRLVPLES